MSVSQVKKRFGEMESYLGRDKEGLRKLKLLKDDVNVLRTSLAAAEEKAELAEVVKNAARDRADKAETEAEALRLENERLDAKLKSMQRELLLASSQKTESNDECQKADDEDGEIGKALRLIAKLYSKIDPPFTTLLVNGIKTVLYNRDTLSHGWSAKAMLKLGAAVALIADTNGAIVIVSESSEVAEFQKGRGGRRLFKGLMTLQNPIMSGPRSDIREIVRDTIEARHEAGIPRVY